MRILDFMRKQGKIVVDKLGKCPRQNNSFHVESNQMARNSGQNTQIFRRNNMRKHTQKLLAMLLLVCLFVGMIPAAMAAVPSTLYLKPSSN